MAIIILIVGIAATSQLIILPLIKAYQDSQKRILDAATLLQRYQEIVAKQPTLVENLKDRLESVQVNGAYLKGPTTALASADLQDRSRRAIEAAGSEIKSAEVLPAIVVEDQEALYRVGVRVRFTTTNTKLPAIFFDLESGAPYLFLDRLAITTDARETFRLDVRLDIIGFLRKHEPIDLLFE